MPIDLTGLSNQVAATEGVEASATRLIEGFSQAISEAVAAALQADANADAETEKVAQEAIDAVTARFKASADTLGAAVAANPGASTPLQGKSK